ncbi:hypothetical protein SD77_2452 [Bacillus badius]|uniref:Uncharacterized protein n=1 Tax=Bacillus badius TaxID=1455 RepID=A0ABR5B0E6_BACBA|nr:hypothetical protein SD77_2452 [Bacillus badius]
MKQPFRFLNDFQVIQEKDRPFGVDESGYFLEIHGSENKHLLQRQFFNSS